MFFSSLQQRLAPPDWATLPRPGELSRGNQFGRRFPRRPARCWSTAKTFLVDSLRRHLKGRQNPEGRLQRTAPDRKEKSAATGSFTVAFTRS